jgi:hypothetical protein
MGMKTMIKVGLTSNEVHLIFDGIESVRVKERYDYRNTAINRLQGKLKRQINSKYEYEGRRLVV